MTHLNDDKTDVEVYHSILDYLEGTLVDRFDIDYLRLETKIPLYQLEDALPYLVEDGFVSKENNEYFLSPENRDEIKKHYSEGFSDNDCWED